MPVLFFHDVEKLHIRQYVSDTAVKTTDGRNPIAQLTFLYISIMSIVVKSVFKTEKNLWYESMTQ